MIDTNKTIIEKFNRITAVLIEKNLTAASMESCTGGMIGMLLSDREGASAVIKGGFFTYSNEAKISCGVAAEMIEKFGVYSLETAKEMASAVRRKFGSDIGIGVTGSIGTIDPNNNDSIPGEVYIAVDVRGDVSDQMIEIEPASRWDSRMEIANRVAELLEKCINV